MKKVNTLHILDANNLYRWGMSQKLLYKDIDWLSDKEVDKLDVEKLNANGDSGYTLQADLE